MPLLFSCLFSSSFFFFNDTATTEIYTLSLHDALPISIFSAPVLVQRPGDLIVGEAVHKDGAARSEEHTSELQSHSDLVCRLLLEKKKKNKMKLKHNEPQEIQPASAYKPQQLNIT